MEEDVRPPIYLASVCFRFFELLCLSFSPFCLFLSVFVFSSYSIYMTDDSVCSEVIDLWRKM